MTDSQLLVKTLFKEKGKPVIMTESQTKIFDMIFYKEHPYNVVIAHTRYGKSFITALAVLARAISVPEKWTIVAPTEKQAKIIMNYIIEHSFDNEVILEKLALEEGESLERLRRERSKTRLTFKHFSSGRMSEIYVLSAHSSKQDPLKGLMGFGAENVILDESALINDKVYAGILRMLGDSPRPFLLELGNPFFKNHFYEATQDPKFNKLIVDYETGLKEGRITIDQVELMRKQQFFDVLYECKFPSHSDIVTPEQIRYTMIGPDECNMFSIGTDLAVSESETADKSAIVVSGRVKDTSRIKVLYSIQGNFTPNEMTLLVKNLYDKWHKRGEVIIGVEDVAYQRSFAKELERRFLLSPVLVKRTTDKRSRMLMLNPYFQNRQIEFFGDKSKYKELTDQLLNFGMVEHDDLADAFEMSISLLKDYLIKEKPKPRKLSPAEAEKERVREMIKRINRKHLNPDEENYENY